MHLGLITTLSLLGCAGETEPTDSVDPTDTTRTDTGDTDTEDTDTDTEPVPENVGFLANAVHMTGDATDDFAGMLVRGVGDVTGDKSPDFIVNALYGGDDAQGKSYLVTELPSDGTLSEVSTADFTGWQGDGASGANTHAIGDVDGDGHTDLAISSLFTDGLEAETGTVSIMRGPFSGSHALEDAEATLLGATTDEWFGYGLASVGDWDGDGVSEVAMAAHSRDTDYDTAGAVLLVSGDTTGELAPKTMLGSGANDGAGYGYSMAAGDVNGDGVGDLIVGAPDNGGDGPGHVYVLEGPADPEAIPAATLIGEGTGTLFGWAVDSGGDTNNDGLDDIVVGAPFHSNLAGAAYVLEAPFEGEMMASNATAAIPGDDVVITAGWSVAMAGDLNGDDHDDVVVGATNSFAGDYQQVGAATLFLGPVEGIRQSHDYDAFLMGEVPGDSCGWSVDGAGDMDGDGLDDVLVGATGNDLGGTQAGLAYLWLSDADLF